MQSAGTELGNVYYVINIFVLNITCQQMGNICQFNSYTVLYIFCKLFIIPKFCTAVEGSFLHLDLLARVLSAQTNNLGRGCSNRRFQNPGIARKGGGADPCQDFSGEFDLQYS